MPAIDFVDATVRQYHPRRPAIPHHADHTRDMPNIAQLTADLRKSGFFAENADTAECRLSTPLKPEATLDAVVSFVYCAWLNFCKRIAPSKAGAKASVQVMEGELVLRNGG